MNGAPTDEHVMLALVLIESRIFRNVYEFAWKLN